MRCRKFLSLESSNRSCFSLVLECLGLSLGHQCGSKKIISFSGLLLDALSCRLSLLSRCFLLCELLLKSGHLWCKSTSLLFSCDPGSLLLSSELFSLGCGRLSFKTGNFVLFSEAGRLLSDGCVVQANDGCEVAAFHLWCVKE